MHLVSALDDTPPERPGGPRPLPSRALLLTEPLRGVATLATLPLAAPLLAMAPRGDGHGVLVLPGLMATDLSTRPLRRFLRTKGYAVQGWGLGRNVGPTAAINEGMPRVLSELVERTGEPASIVGWSLGGIFARELARARPDLVRQVVTLASPFAMTNGSSTHADGAFRRRSSQHARGNAIREDLRRPIPVPSTAVFSRADGIVGWRDCIEPATAIHENVEVRSGHLAVGVDAAVMWLLADRLSLPARGWRPFQAPSLLRPLFPQVQRP